MRHPGTNMPSPNLQTNGKSVPLREQQAQDERMGRAASFLPLASAAMCITNCVLADSNSQKKSVGKERPEGVHATSYIVRKQAAVLRLVSFVTSSPSSQPCGFFPNSDSLSLFTYFPVLFLTMSRPSHTESRAGLWVSYGPGLVRQVRHAPPALLRLPCPFFFSCLFVSGRDAWTAAPVWVAPSWFTEDMKIPRH